MQLDENLPNWLSKLLYALGILWGLLKKICRELTIGFIAANAYLHIEAFHTERALGTEWYALISQLVAALTIPCIVLSCQQLTVKK